MDTADFDIETPTAGTKPSPDLDIPILTKPVSVEHFADDDIPVLEDIATAGEMSMAHEIAERVVARLNAKRRARGEPALDAGVLEALRAAARGTRAHSARITDSHPRIMNDDNRPADNAGLSKAYDPHAIEARIYDAWEKAGSFRPSGQGAPYCIMIPPPNVTGSLHMGHAFQDTLMDALTRYRRMKGDNTLWQAGTDHAGIATQMVVERQLLTEGKTRHDLGREKFIRRVWDWKAHSGGMITRQLRRMGASLDWSRERFTMDEGLSHAVTEVFVRLHDEGLIYRGKRLVNWDPVLHTAVSDLEVVSEEEAGSLWHIRYPIAGTKDFLVVATTRPETMLGDTAVAVHPEDERCKHLIGKQVELPLTGRTIPVIADEYVDKEFGSGCVKITPAHDFNDYEVGKRHQLPLINILSRTHASVWRAPHITTSTATTRAKRLSPISKPRGCWKDRATQAHGAAWRSHPRRPRTAPDGPVVRESRPARGRGDKSRRRRAHQVRARELDQDLL